jgi:hypothetical protein
MLTGKYFAQSLQRRHSFGVTHMTTLKSIFLLTVLMILATTAPAFALTIDVCATAATDARFDSTGKFFTAAAPIYPGGTIAPSSTAINCADITATPIGTFFTIGSFVAGLAGAGTDDLALVTWHFRIGSRAFDTIGPVQAAGGVFAPGQTYPQTVVGSTHGLTAANGEATVTTLDPSGFVFELKAPSSDNDHHKH